jgi:hypothetical protein
MGFSSNSDLTAEITAGKFYRLPFQRIINTGATSVAGRWHECFASVGTGGTGVLTGTAGVGAALSNATVGALPEVTNTTTPDTRHLLTIMGATAATTLVPSLMTLTDLLYIYPSCVLTGAATTLNNGVAKPTRAGTGVGVQVSAFVVGAVGAATPLLTVTYTNSDGVGSRVGTLIASAASLPVGAALTGGTVASLGGPYMILQAGDKGVQSINSYAITSGGTTGTVTFVLNRPLTTVPLVAANLPGERDLLNQFPSLPQINDAACLAVMVQTGGALLANQIIYGELQVAWG